MKGGRKRVSKSDQEGGVEKEKKRGGTGEEILENEGLGEKMEEEDGEEEEGDDNEEEEEEEERNGERKNEERTKLADGFFEIEAIRRKRVRKGQLQYLIKWRRWPETANTWEPLENLQSCSDVIDVFEESLRSGEHGRKRKRKQGGPHTQSKKETSSSIATYNGTGLEVSVIDKPPLVPIDDSGIADLSASSTVTVSAREGERNGNGSNVKRSKRVKGNSSANGSKKIDETKDENDYDTKLSELKGVLSSKVANADKLAVRFQEGKASEGDGPVNGLPRVGESVLSDRRTGAKRTKPGSVKRFKQDSASSGPNSAQNAIRVGYANTDADMEIVNLGLTADGLSHRPLIDNSVNVPVITKIIKSVEFSASVSDNNQDVSVTFLALRSDGKEVMVDNQYLKANNPLLLINFYEQHLKYSPPS
ncbi:LIKE HETEROCHROMATIN PROTEIN 1, TERMINAL FLOWER 2 [Hibiscus trionum]|uniref:LIKE HETEROCHROMATIN PROTEIN 1, TERMINAL FLOWER 2 n=1 Tax=Hibiscus trionum TaxID=183268 RepID=A0A9W7LVT8_HIBTR|nr:LIKE HETEROCHROMATIN PROTEIN 1, TERMINAL FLOWER 2 [Hibiscus trionum]